MLAAALAVTLQVEATLPLGSTGIRMALSDLVLPVSVVYLASRFVRSPCQLRWRMPGVAWWLLGIAMIMSIALLIGHERLGRWSWWALGNKWAGWFVLVAYFMVGGALVRLGGTALRAAFLRAFLAWAAIVALLNSLAMPWLFGHYTLPFGVEFDRATGAMQNSNAFGFLVTVAVLLAIATEARIWLYLPPLVTALWFTASRGALLAFSVGITIELALLPGRVAPVLKASAIAFLAIAVMTALSMAIDPHTLSDIKSGAAPVGFLSAERLDPGGGTIRKREAQNEHAISLIAQAPIFGQGLGYIIEKTGVSLHNSLLWLIIETGLVGAALVTGFLATALCYLFLGRSDPFLLGMVAVSAAFMVMSVTGEFLYQRHLWLLLGMALAVPSVAPRAV